MKESTRIIKKAYASDVVSLAAFRPNRSKDAKRTPEQRLQSQRARIANYRAKWESLAATPDLTPVSTFRINDMLKRIADREAKIG